MTWVDSVYFRERWDIKEQLPSGAQGEAFKACRKTDGQLAFLKVIKGQSKSNLERRARFFREANAYDTFSVHNMPKLIESNAHLHADTNIHLYIATEFIDGLVLSKWRSAQSHVDLNMAVETTRALLMILRGIHPKNCHRDIKPDNLILRDGDYRQVVLVDFGLNFHEIPDLTFQTEHGQEIGNRFLRLPELSAGSEHKQDARSDISFAAGILFYLLTNEHPDQLQDAEGRLPHQRSQALATLQRVAGPSYPRLAALFDNAFAPHIFDRFTSVDAMLTSLDGVMAEHEIGHSAEDDLAAILEIVDTRANQRKIESNKKIHEALAQVKRIHEEVKAELRGAFNLGQTNYNIQGTEGANTLFWIRTGTNETVASTTYAAKEAGDEIVIQMSGETVYRTSVLFPRYEEEFKQAVSSWLLARIRTAISNPNALPPEAECFHELTPVGDLIGAADKARETGKRILAFVYDPAQKARGQLAYCLGYFLQNKKTRDILNSSFILALVPLSQLSAQSDILAGQSMETSRWVVLEADFTPLEQAVIYANSQEGERIAARLAQRYTI